MSPSAEPANLLAEADALVPDELIQDGEVILLAVKPSRWHVLLASWPVLVLAGVVIGATVAASRFFEAAVNERMVALICSAIACTRVTIACFQWLGRLYVLTDRRVIRLRGVFRQDVFQRPLKQLQRLQVTATPPERLVGIGSLLFEFDTPGPRGEGDWTHLVEVREVHQAVADAWRRAR